MEARNANEIDSAFAAITQDRAGASIVLVDSLLLDQRTRIVHHAARRRLPTVFGVSEFVGLRELGWVEGQTVVVERRGASGDRSRIPSLAAELAQLKVNLILASTGADAKRAQEGTRTGRPHHRMISPRPRSSFEAL